MQNKGIKKRTVGGNGGQHLLHTVKHAAVYKPGWVKGGGGGRHLRIAGWENVSCRQDIDSCMTKERTASANPKHDNSKP